MAHNPKLNVFIIKLNPRTKEDVTFREFFRQKYHADQSTKDSDVYKLFYADVINALGNKEFNNDLTSKKVIGVSQSDNNSVEFSIREPEQLIDGLLDGGPYGLKREYADIADKDSRKQIDTSEAVLDKFYIMLNTPYNQTEGYLLVQSYTESSITESIKKALYKVFMFDDKYFQPDFSPFVPKSFVEKFEKESTVRLFSYDTILGVSPCLRDDIDSEGRSFNVRIELSPLDKNIRPGTSYMETIIEALGELLFNGKRLSETSRKIYIEDGNKRKVNYDVEKELKSIRPTIYLEDEGISIDPQTGLLNYVAVKEFCLNQLNDIKKERRY